MALGSAPLGVSPGDLQADLTLWEDRLFPASIRTFSDAPPRSQLCALNHYEMGVSTERFLDFH